MAGLHPAVVTLDEIYWHPGLTENPPRVCFNFAEGLGRNVDIGKYTNGQAKSAALSLGGNEGRGDHKSQNHRSNAEKEIRRHGPMLGPTCRNVHSHPVKPASYFLKSSYPGKLMKQKPFPSTDLRRGKNQVYAARAMLSGIRRS
jgi:hypothetical protein